MKISLSTHAAHDATCDLLVLGVHSDEVTRESGIKSLDKALEGGLLQAVKDQAFGGRVKEQLVLHTLGNLPARRVALVGLGPKADLTAAHLVRLGGTATRLGNSHGAKKVHLVLQTAAGREAAATKHVTAITRGLHLGGYRYTRYRSEAGRTPTVAEVHLHVAGAKAAGAKEAVSYAQVVSEAVMLVRDLVNEPAQDMYPESMAERARSMARKLGVKCTVLDVAGLKKHRMNMILAVGKASDYPPRFVHLAYIPKKAAGKKPVVLVGKGVTFDSGGLDLKPPDGMLGMKVDMGGSATVLATVLAAAKLKLNVPVHGLLSLAENMVAGNALRPGDVSRHATGKTVEINNTDAEGRLVLSDALHYAQALKPDCIVDLATLTGACMVALGPHTVGLFCNNDPLANELLDFSAASGEHFWRMPLTPVLRDQLKSDIADMRNTGERYGGAITAALFLKEFVGDIPWAHLDIAGPVTTQEDHGAATKGATGIAVATLLAWIGARDGARGRK